MTATLATLETRLKNYLSDSTSIVFQIPLLDEGIRLALGQLNLTLTQAYIISGLDGAGSTTLPTNLESLIVVGSSGYAAQSRAVKRTESFNLDQQVANDLLVWGHDRLTDFSAGLSLLLNQASTAAKIAADAAHLTADTAHLAADSIHLAADTAHLTAETARVTADTANLATDRAAAAAATAAEAARLAALHTATIPPFPTATTTIGKGWLTDDEDAGEGPYGA